MILERTRYLLLDADGTVLGGALMLHISGERRARLFWNLPFVEGARWIVGGKRKRRPHPGEWLGIGAIPYARGTPHSP